MVIVKEPGCSVEAITAIIQKSIPEGGIEQNIGAELSYSLPDTKSHLFPEMFTELEERKRELGIASYGCSITTMEEVFMKVGKIAEEKETMINNNLNGTAKKEAHVSIETLQGNAAKYKLYDKTRRNDGFKLLLQQFRAMLVKKMTYALRNRLLLIFQVNINQRSMPLDF